MSDRDALLRAICESPDDDAPRLIYADWLDEHGDPLQAEFIRVQIELARCSHSERRTVLVEREKALWRSLRKWRYVLGNWLHLYLGHFQRGFNTTWTGSITELRRGVAEYWLLGPIQKLRLEFPPRFRGSTKSAPTILSCPLLGHVSELDLYGPSLYDAWVDLFMRCHFAPRWRRVSLNGQVITDQVCRIVLASPLVSSGCELLIAAPLLSPESRALLEDAFQSRINVTN